MMPDIDINLGDSVLFFVKWGITIFLVVYNLFALIVVKQVKVMNDTLDVGFERPIFLLALAHMVFAIFVLVAAIVLL